MSKQKAHKVVQVGLGERSYPIRIEKGQLDRIGEDLRQKRIAKRYAVISDVSPL